MMNNKLRRSFLYAILVLAFIAVWSPSSQAAFDKLTSGLSLHCGKSTKQMTLSFISGAPAGDYSFQITPFGSYGDFIGFGDGGFGQTYNMSFNIPGDESGVSFDVNVNEDLLGSATDFPPGGATADISLTGGDQLTMDTNFGTITGSVLLKQDGCNGNDNGGGDNGGSDDGDSTLSTLLDGVLSTDPLGFTTILVSDVKEAEQDLMIDFTYKLDSTVFALVQSQLGDDKDITDELKKLAKKFKIKLNIKNLRKLANKEIKEAVKGKKGEERAQAIKDAMSKGISKLIDTIRLKIPRLPKRGAPNRDQIKEIRQAKRKKIFEALVVELVENKDGTQDGKAVKCLKFKITLPAKVCAKLPKAQKALIDAIRLSIDDIAPGETFTTNLEATVLGDFQQFFGTDGDGVVEIPITISNPASGE